MLFKKIKIKLHILESDELPQFFYKSSLATAAPQLFAALDLLRLNPTYTKLQNYAEYKLYLLLIYLYDSYPVPTTKMICPSILSLWVHKNAAGAWKHGTNLSLISYNSCKSQKKTNNDFAAISKSICYAIYVSIQVYTVTSRTTRWKALIRKIELLNTATRYWIRTRYTFLFSLLLISMAIMIQRRKKLKLTWCSWWKSRQS